MFIYLQMIDSYEEQSKFEKIYLTYRGLMFHVANKILINEQDAEDAVGQAFVKIAENIKKISNPICPKTRSYVVIIVEHTAIDMYRKLQKHPYETLDDSVCGVTVEYNGDNELTRCILELPARYREIILLRYHHGLTIREIAKTLGISNDAASKLAQRAKHQLEEKCREAGLL